MNAWDYDAPWYHGSPNGNLTALRKGSAITQNRDAARAFSHKPAIVSVSGSSISHNGKVENGYLYRVCEKVRPEDVDCTDFKGNEDRIQWLIVRELAVEFIGTTTILKEELLAEQDIAALKEKAQRLRSAT